jgi:hypothetical protein
MLNEQNYFGNEIKNRDSLSPGFVVLSVLLEIKSAVFRSENVVDNSRILDSPVSVFRGVYDATTGLFP